MCMARQLALVGAYVWSCAPHVQVGVALVGAVQAGPTLQFLECGSPTVGQLMPIVSVEALDVAFMLSASLKKSSMVIGSL